MNRRQSLPAIRRLLQSADAAAFERLVRTTPPADLVRAFDRAPPAATAARLLGLPPDLRSELFSHFDAPQQDAMLAALPRPAVVDLFERMPADDRVDLFNRLGGDERAALLPALAQVERDDILRLAAHPEGSVGALTTSDYATAGATMSAAQALQALRESAPDKETIYAVYVLDAERRLIGTVSLRELVLAAPAAPVAALMRADPVRVRVDEPREKAAELIDRYDLLALPVVDADDRMVGIVTVDDAMDVAREASTEDIHKGGGVGPLEGLSVGAAGVRLLFEKRVVWLLALVFGNLFSSAGIACFEDLIAAFVALVFFLPLLIGSGGNAGAQASTLMVRALATGDVVPGDWLRLLGRELLIALLLGLAMALAVSGIGWLRGGPEIALVVALAMVTVVIISSLIGMSLPFLLTRLKLDPATASGPLVTTIADAAGVVIYLGIAVLVLGWPA